MVFFLSKYNKKVTKQEIYFALSQVTASIIFIHYSFNEYINIKNNNVFIYPKKILLISLGHYILDLFILNLYKFDNSFKLLMSIHHIISIIIFILIWYYYEWDNLTIICTLIWRIGDIPQAFYKGWIIQLNNYYENLFGTLKISLRISSYLIPIVLYLFKGNIIKNKFETYSALIMQLLLHFFLDKKTTFRFIKNLQTWGFILLILILIILFF